MTDEERIRQLELALSKAWLYDNFQCAVCFGMRPWGTDEPVVHEPDCIVPSVLERVEAMV